MRVDGVSLLLSFTFNCHFLYLSFSVWDVLQGLDLLLFLNSFLYLISSNYHLSARRDRSFKRFIKTLKIGISTMGGTKTKQSNALPLIRLRYYSGKEFYFWQLRGKFERISEESALATILLKNRFFSQFSSILPNRWENLFKVHTSRAPTVKCFQIVANVLFMCLVSKFSSK